MTDRPQQAHTESPAAYSAYHVSGMRLWGQSCWWRWLDVRKQDRRRETEAEIQTCGEDDLMNCTLQPFLFSCYIPREKIHDNACLGVH